MCGRNRRHDYRIAPHFSGLSELHLNRTALLLITNHTQYDKCGSGQKAQTTQHTQTQHIKLQSTRHHTQTKPSHRQPRDTRTIHNNTYNSTRSKHPYIHLIRCDSIITAAHVLNRKNTHRARYSILPLLTNNSYTAIASSPPCTVLVRKPLTAQEIASYLSSQATPRITTDDIKHTIQQLRQRAEDITYPTHACRHTPLQIQNDGQYMQPS